MKKGKVLLIAAALAALLAVTVAAVGGIDYFRSLFGDSALNAGESIIMPGIEARGPDGATIRSEAVLSDGYQTDVIFSTYYGENVENRDGELLNQADENLDAQGFVTQIDNKLSSSSIEEMPEFTHGERRYFHLHCTAMENCMGSTVRIQKGTGGPVLEIPLNGAVSVRTVELGLDVGGGRVIESAQLSPMGILLLSSEQEAKGSLPTVAIEIVMKNGKREKATVEFDQSDDEGMTVGGGGSAVMVGPGQKAPLVVMTEARRSPDGRLTAMGTFSRLLDMGKVKSLVVEGTEYPLTDSAGSE